MNNPTSYRYYAKTRTDAWDQPTIDNVWRLQMTERDGDLFPTREETWWPIMGQWVQTDNALIRYFYLGSPDFDDISEADAFEFIRDQLQRELWLEDQLSTMANGTFGTSLIRTPERDPREDDFAYVQFAKEEGAFFVEFSSNKFLKRKLTDAQVEAILAAGWNEPEKGVSPNYWREYRADDSNFTIASDVLGVMRKAFISEQPDVMQRRWFGLASNEGGYAAFYRADFDGCFLRSSEVWNELENVWKDTETISKWWVFGDTNIDEFDLAEAQARLPKAAIAG